MGIAFVNEHSACVSEGNSGKDRPLRLERRLDAPGPRRVIDLNQNGYAR